MGMVAKKKHAVQLMNAALRAFWDIGYDTAEAMHFKTK